MSEKKKGGFKGPSLYLTIEGGMTFADYTCPYDCGDMRPCPYVQGWVDPMDEDDRCTKLDTQSGGCRNFEAKKDALKNAEAEVQRLFEELRAEEEAARMWE